MTCSLTKEQLIDFYESQKLTIKEIAKQTGYSVFTVRKYLDQYEIPRPKANPVPLAELKRLYLEERLSVPEIAARVGVHRNGVYQRLRKSGITLRTGAEKRSATAGVSRDAFESDDL